MIKKFWKDESGVSAVEYVILLALLGTALLAAVTYFYGKLAESFNGFADDIPQP